MRGSIASLIKASGPNKPPPVCCVWSGWFGTVVSVKATVNKRRHHHKQQQHECEQTEPAQFVPIARGVCVYDNPLSLSRDLDIPVRGLVGLFLADTASLNAACICWLLGSRWRPTFVLFVLWVCLFVVCYDRCCAGCLHMHAVNHAHAHIRQLQMLCLPSS